MAISPTKIGVIGCGNIAWAYLTAGQRFDILEIVACADMDLARAQAKAEEYNIPRACTVDELLADPEIEIVVNLTPPAAHGEIALRVLEAGKHAYGEKPFAVTREEGQQVLKLAAAKGLRCGGAPDTFLGAGIQTCRKLIDDGWIGQPLSATAFMLGHGPDRWHPNPDFFYQTGGGPLFDMGPYYLTALTNLLGPTKAVAASATKGFTERIITSQPHYGEIMQVNVPTHVIGIMEFSSGAVANLIMSFDVWAHHLPCIEIHGTEGSLSVPDPNTFGGPVRLKRHDHENWTDMALSHGYAEQNRGLGVADLAYALRSGRPHRASGELCYHVLDLMHSFYDAAAARSYVNVASTCAQPAALPVGLRPGTLDE